MSRWLKSGLKFSVFKGQSTPRSTQTTPTADTTWRNNRLTLLTFNIVITPPPTPPNHYISNPFLPGNSEGSDFHSQFKWRKASLLMFKCFLVNIDFMLSHMWLTVDLIYEVIIKTDNGFFCARMGGKKGIVVKKRRIKINIKINIVILATVFL